MIPAGSQINARLAAETCDEQRFENPHTLDLDLVVDRLWAGSHVAFWLWQKPLSRRSTCPKGAALVVQGTRRSRHPSFKALIDQIDTVRFSEGTNDFSYHPRYLLRAMKSLHLELTPT